MKIDDERAIVAVLVRYATAIDRRDWDLFATCFTHDLEADYGEIGSWRGRKSFVDFMEQGHAPIGPTLHRLTNFVVVGDARQARATSYVDALLLRPAPGVPFRRAHGSYEDRLLREEDGWKIEKRRFRAVLIDTSDLG
jgi:SnoaL-like domain